MKIRSLILFVLAAVVCGAFLCADSQAKVCFLGESCGTGYNFADGKDVPEELNKLCKKEGYNLDAGTGDAGKVCGTNQIEYKCPYSARWRMCCGADYTYSQCGSGLVSKGVCGGKHKCECDTSLFPYKQASATMCSKYDSSLKFENSLAAGASCVYSSLESGSLSMVSRFEKCMCDRGLYPKPASECEEGGAAGAGIKCTDSDGNNFYQTCECNYSLYPIMATTCEFGTYTSDKLCQEGALYYAPRCCECTLTEYPYRSSPDTTKVKEWVSCKSREHCTGGGAVFRATKCQKGYKLSGGECVPVSCDEAVQIHLADSSNTSHAVLKSDGAYKAVKTTDSNGNEHYSWSKITDTTKRTYILSGNVTVSSAPSAGSTVSSYSCTAFQCKSNDTGKVSYSNVSSSCSCSNCCERRIRDDGLVRDPSLGGDDLGLGGNNGFQQPEVDIIKPDTSVYYYCSSSIGCTGVCDPSNDYMDTKVCISHSANYSYTYKGIAGVPSDGNSETYISALNYLSSYSTSAINKDTGLSAIKRSCTVNPTLTYSASKFPLASEGDKAATMYFKGVNLKFSSTTTSNRAIVIDDGDLNVGSLTQNKSLTVNGGNVSGTLLKAKGNVRLNAGSGTTPTYSVTNSYFYHTSSAGKLHSTNYNFKFNNLRFVTNVSSETEVANITLAAGGTMKSNGKTKAYGISLYPSASAFGSDYNSYINIVGPSSATEAQVDSNIFVGNNNFGNDSSDRPSTNSMKVYLKSNVALQLLNGYMIGLSTNSFVEAQSYGGYAAAIRQIGGNAVTWKKCSAINHIYITNNAKHTWLDTGECTLNFYPVTRGQTIARVGDGDCELSGAPTVHFVVSIKADGTKAFGYPHYMFTNGCRCNTVQNGCNTDSDCSQPTAEAKAGYLYGVGYDDGSKLTKNSPDYISCW